MAKLNYKTDFTMIMVWIWSCKNHQETEMRQKFKLGEFKLGVIKIWKVDKLDCAKNYDEIWLNN